jgi:hypothetical protein
MSKCAFMAVAMAALCVAASGGCCNVEQFCGMNCGHHGCYDCDSCSSCGSCGHSYGGCSSCDSSYDSGCSSCGRSHSRCSSCDSSSDSGCSSCGRSHGGCGNCGECGDCCDSCGDCELKKLFWPLDCGLVSGCKKYCHEPESFDSCGGGGCGEKYWCDWKSCPPTCDPCDKCSGSYCGGCPCQNQCYQASPRFGSVPWPAWPPHDGPEYPGDDYVGQKSKATSTH